MEGLREQLVKRPMTTHDRTKKALIMTGSVIIAVVIFAVLGVFVTNWFALEIGALLLVGLVWGGWLLAGRLNVEYEYIIVGGEMSVDKIFNKKSRKTLCSLQLRTAEGFFKGERTPDDAFVIDVCGSGEKYTIEYSDPDRGHTALIFTPDERTLELLKPYLPRLS